ncbi:hypothetical protein ACFSUD_15085, partial [Sulfitobacter aestuarii]
MSRATSIAAVLMRSVGFQPFRIVPFPIGNRPNDLNKECSMSDFFTATLAATDPDIAAAVTNELGRQ